MNPLSWPSVAEDQLLDRLQGHFTTYRTDDASMLREVASHLSRYYAEYTAAMAHGAQGASERLGPAHAQVMRDAYLVLRGASSFADVRRSLWTSLLGTNGYCPFCSLSTADTLDHFAPKDGLQGYPEFAVYCLNLVPMCDSCNRKKGSLSAPTVREINFPHAYIDSADYAQVQLEGSVDVTAPLPFLSLHLIFDPGIPVSVRRRFESACERLELMERWSFVAQGEMALVASDFTEIATAGDLERIERELEVRATSAARTYGRNSLRAAVYRCLSTSRDFWRGPFSALVGPMVI